MSEGFTIRIRGAAAFVSREFTCHSHGTFDELVPSPTPASWPCPACSAPAILAMSAPIGRAKLGEVSRGKVAEAPHHLALDTRPLAEGMPLGQWKKQRAKLWNDKRRADWKAKLG